MPYSRCLVRDSLCRANLKASVALHYAHYNFVRIR